jgi:uncharacterized protein YdiU (UPF0061 family)
MNADDTNNLIKQAVIDIKKKTKYDAINAFKKTFEIKYRDELFKRIGLTRNGTWGSDYMFITGGRAEDILTKALNDSEELVDIEASMLEAFKHAAPLTPTQVKDIKAHVRNTLRNRAIKEVTNEVTRKLDQVVIEYANDVVKNDPELDELFELYRFVNL